MLHRLLFILLILAVPVLNVLAQQTTIYGKIKDAETGDPVPFANVIIKGTQIGTTTDFDVIYKLTTNARVDTILFSYVGYEQMEVAVKNGYEQQINVQLLQNVIRLKELVVYPGENPAFAIMRKVAANKKLNDKRQLDAYQYESYTKIEVDLDNMSESFRQRKVIQKVKSVLDSIQTIAGDHGEPILPVFFSEAISNYYVKNNPFLRHEYIIRTSVTGLGLTDGTTTSQVIGATFQEYNFYRNFLTILEKEFASPISSSWKSMYEYDLIDSSYIDDDFCYRIDYFPKRRHDLAFSGIIWITKDDYALKQIDALVSKSSNLNFVEKLRIQQELIKTEAGPWLPKKTRVLVDIDQPADNMAGLLAKFYTSADKFKINEAKDDDFYRMPIEMDVEVRQADDAYWERYRHEKLTKTEVNVYHMVDTLKKIPVIKAYSDIVKLAYTGYYKWGKVDIGPYPLFLSFNDVEGLRLGFGGETNYDFSKKFIIRTYVGYGFNDIRWKYMVGLDYVASRKPWLKFGSSVSREVDPVYLLFEPLEGQIAFYAFTRLGVLRRPFVHDKYQLRMETQLARDLNLRIALRHDYLQPLQDFMKSSDNQQLAFEYYSKPGQDPTSIQENLTSTEVNVALEWAKDRKYLVNDNYRYSSGLNRYPVITLRFTAGLKGVFGSDFAYNKVGLNIVKRFRMGQFGTSVLTVDGEYIFGAAPYPLLKNHLGNETPFYSPNAFSLMDYFEFTSDRYVSATYRHHFNGAIMNRLPLLKFLKLRLFGEARVLVGNVRQENIDIMVPLIINGNAVPHFNSLAGQPYIELGYGVENILKVIQINFIHRIAAVDQTANSKFGLKIGFQFTL